eukprot:TRINITY_DN4630_c0_g1_i1.p1 TRINITY_DN4630_c0_g1~~TRINITY_DN4630_c0_g1_i1.p1  ORF type:complete len:224 (+),score=38.94 TRINITY_DN4630_c0_g1_i1:47-718(+)
MRRINCLLTVFFGCMLILHAQEIELMKYSSICYNQEIRDLMAPCDEWCNMMRTGCVPDSFKDNIENKKFYDKCNDQEQLLFDEKLVQKRSLCFESVSKDKKVIQDNEPIVENRNIDVDDAELVDHEKLQFIQQYLQLFEVFSVGSVTPEKLTEFYELLRNISESKNLNDLYPMAQEVLFGSSLVGLKDSTVIYILCLNILVLWCVVFVMFMKMKNQPKGEKVD